MTTSLRVNFASLPVALRDGVLFMAKPGAAWAQVRLRPAGLQALVLDYALWWLLLATLQRSGLQLVLGLAAQGGDGGELPWAMVLMGAANMFSGGLVAVVALAYLAQVFAASLGPVRPLWQDGLRLTAYGLTPVWLGLVLWQLPGAGNMLMLAALVAAGLCVWLGLGPVLGVQPDKRKAFMWRFCAAAAGLWLLIAVMHIMLPFLLFVLLVAWNKLKNAPAVQDAINAANGAPSENNRQADVQAAAVAVAAAGDTNLAPDFTGSPAPSPAPAPAVMLQPTPVQTEKLAALDKKIAKAMAKGDMAEVTRLMGEQQALRMAADGVRADF